MVKPSPGFLDLDAGSKDQRERGRQPAGATTEYEGTAFDDVGPGVIRGPETQDGPAILSKAVCRRDAGVF